MKKFIMIFLLLIVLNPLVSLARDFIIVCEDWPPFEYMDKKTKKVVGVDVDIVKHIFDKMGIKFKIEVYPWERAWKMVEDGKADAVLSTSRKDKRKPFLYYPEEDMWMSEYVFFVRKDNKKENFKIFDDAYGLKVGVVSGNSYNQDFWDAKLDVEEVPFMEWNFKKLFGSRIDLIPCDKIIGMNIVKTRELQDIITYYETPIFRKGYPMPFCKKSSYPNIEGIAHTFENELKKIKEDGTYQKILDKWVK